MFWVITRRMRPSSRVSFVGLQEMLVWTFGGDWGSWSASGIPLKCLFGIFFRSREATWGSARSCCRCHIYLIWPANVLGPLRSNQKVLWATSPSGTSCSAKKKKRYGWTNRWIHGYIDVHLKFQKIETNAKRHLLCANSDIFQIGFIPPTEQNADIHLNLTRLTNYLIITALLEICILMNSGSSDLQFSINTGQQ